MSDELFFHNLIILGYISFLSCDKSPTNWSFYLVGKLTNQQLCSDVEKESYVIACTLDKGVDLEVYNFNILCLIPPDNCPQAVNVSVMLLVTPVMMGRLLQIKYLC